MNYIKIVTLALRQSSGTSSHHHRRTIYSYLKCLLFTFSFFTATTPIQSQNCNCTVEQVQNNAVSPCDITVGTVETVATVSALWDAINQANTTGGNMTILIYDGVYQVASTTSFPYITASNVVFRSLSGNRDAVVIKGGGMVPTTSTENGFLIAGDNVVIADLTIKDVGNHGIQVSGHNLYVHNVRIQNTYEQMIKGSTNAMSIDSAIVQCSLMEYTDGVGPNWYIGGLDIHKGKDWIVRDNVFKNISSPAGSVAEHAIHFWDNSINNTVERNLIFNCDRGIGFGLGTNGNQNEGGIIRNNMVYNNGEGLFDDVGIGLESSPNTKVYNNTIFIDYQNAIEYRFVTTTNASIINNLSNRPITSRDGGTGMLQTNETNALPDWFANLLTGDLHLASKQSSVVNQGTELADFVTDVIDQTNRPLGSAYDIGAHEFKTYLNESSKWYTISGDSYDEFYFLNKNQIIGDTIVDGLNYYKVLVTTDHLNQDPFTGDTTTYYAGQESLRLLRENSGRFYTRSNNVDELLHDFNLSLGDTVIVDGFLPSEVIQIDSIMIENEERKVFYLDVGIRIYEGIGTSQGLFIRPSTLGVESFAKLKCYFVNENQYSINNTGPFWDYEIPSCDSVSFEGVTTSNNNITTTNNLTVYPNPFSNNLNLRTNHPIAEECTLTIKDINGRTVWNEKISFQGRNSSVDLSDLSKGIYFLKLKIKEEIYLKKVVKL